jgi:hypothetical protein
VVETRSDDAKCKRKMAARISEFECRLRVRGDALADDMLQELDRLCRRKYINRYVNGAY